MLCQGSLQPGSAFHIRSQWSIVFGEMNLRTAVIRLFKAGILLERVECPIGKMVVFHVTENIEFHVSVYRGFGRKLHAGIEIHENGYNCRSKKRWPISFAVPETFLK